MASKAPFPSLEPALSSFDEAEIESLLWSDKTLDHNALAARVECATSALA